MQPSVAATLIAFFGLAAAIPLESRAPGDVILCSEANLTGDCVSLSVPFNACQKVPASLVDNVGSMKVDAGAFCRITFSADTCTAHGDAFINPDTDASDLHHFVQSDGTVVDAGSTFTSFLCQECTACTV